MTDSSASKPKSAAVPDPAFDRMSMAEKRAWLRAYLEEGAAQVAKGQTVSLASDGEIEALLAEAYQAGYEAARAASIETAAPTEHPSFDSAEEDALAVAAYDRAMAARDTAAARPLALVRRILRGEHPVKVWRGHRGLTQAALAEAAGLQQSTVADIERGRRGISFETAMALADALGTSLDDLRPPREPSPPSVPDAADTAAE